MKKPNIIERIESHPGVQTGFTLISTFHPAAAVLPTLLNCAANARMQSRVDDAIQDLELQVSSMTEQVSQMSDDQYKFVCEVISNLQRTNDVEKINYLKRAVINGIIDSNLNFEKAYVTSRVLRDISSLEVNFLITAIRYPRILVAAEEKDGSVPVSDAGAYTISNSVKNQTIINGLKSLGLVADDGTWGDGYVPTPIAFTLIGLLH